MDTGAVILTSFLSTIPVYLFFATGFYLRHKQVIQADHDAPIMRIAMDVAYRFGIKAEQQFNYTPKKNSADMALTIDALDLLHQSSYDALAIVSSDCDFTPVSLYVREHGIYVIGIGEKKTPEAFKKSCNEFILLKTADSKIDNTLQNKPSQSGSEKRKKSLNLFINYLRRHLKRTKKKDG